MPHRQGAFARPVERWGDIITCDHMVQTDEPWTIGCEHSRDCLVVKDLATGYKGVYPMNSKSGDNTEEALRLFTGGHRVKLCYSDGSLEIADACRRLGFPHETSQPGVPQNNGIIERCNGDILSMARTALIHAGIPNHVWPYAAQCVCHLDNCSFGEDQPSAWFHCHNRGEFQGQLLPFGCAVWFLPSPTARKKTKEKTSAYVRPKWGGGVLSVVSSLAIK